MRITTSLLVFGLLAGCSSAPAPAKPAAAAPAATADADKKICREEKALRSLIAKSICHTAAEWAAIDASQKQSAEKYKDDSKRVAGGEEQ
jgi:hypothetical protein